MGTILARHHVVKMWVPLCGNQLLLCS